LKADNAGISYEESSEPEQQEALSKGKRKEKNKLSRS